MRICLKTYAGLAGSQSVVVKNLGTRLPERIKSPVELKCVFNVQFCDDYYLLALDVQGQLMMTCQRCLGDFVFNYSNKTQLAVCTNDDIAEIQMERFDCIVAKDNEIELTEILYDELHLYAPDKHSDLDACDSEMAGYIGSVNHS